MNYIKEQGIRLLGRCTNLQNKCEQLNNNGLNPVNRLLCVFLSLKFTVS